MRRDDFETEASFLEQLAPPRRTGREDEERGHTRTKGYAGTRYRFGEEPGFAAPSGLPPPIRLFKSGIFISW